LATEGAELKAAARRQRARPRSSKVAVTVTGMHRSGTSAVTRVVSLLGADLPKNVMPARQGNEAGHWEPERIVQLNDEILESANSSPYDVSPFPRSWYGSTVEFGFRTRMMELLEEEYGDSSLLVVKDPRICRLVPFWLATFEMAGVSPSFVLVVRNPLEVAASLKERDGCALSRGLMMWLRHTLDAERETRAHPRVIVSYERLLHDWESVARTIADRLEIPWPRLSNRTRAEVERFLSAEHRHFEMSERDLLRHTAVVEWVKSAYAELRRAADSDEAPNREALDEITRLADDADVAYGPIIGELEADRSLQRLDLEARQRELQDRTQELEHLSDEAAAARAESERLASLLEERDEQLRGREQELQLAASELDARSEEAERLTAELARRQEAIESGKRELQQLSDGAAAALGERERLAIQLSHHESKLEARKRAIEDAQEQLEKRRVQVERLAAELARRQEEIESGKRELQQLSDEAAAARMNSERLASLLEETRASRDKVAGALEARERDLAERQEELAAKDSRIGRLAERVERGRDQLKQARTALAAKDAELQSQALKISRRNEEAGRLRQEMSREQAEAKTLRSELEARAGEVARLHGSVETVREEMARGYLHARPAGLWRSTSHMLSWIVRRRLDCIKAYRALRRSGQFDAGFYLARYPDVLEQRLNPLMHYVEHGAKERRDPSRAFSTSGYLARHPELVANGENPLVHSLRERPATGSELDPPGARQAGVWRSTANLLLWVIRRRFDYIKTFRALRRSGEFDADYYLRCYPDVLEQRLNALMHYIGHGASEGRDPNRAFRTNDYLVRHPELARTGENPLLHFIRAKGALAPENTREEQAPAAIRVAPQADRDPAPPNGRRRMPTAPNLRVTRESRLRRVAGDLVEAGASPLVLRGHQSGRVPIEGVGTFPANDDGMDPGTSGDTAAIANLETLRSAGASHLILPPGSDPWLAERPGVRLHLETRYPPFADHDGFAVHSLDATGRHSVGRALEEFLESYRWRYRGDPSILDWTGRLALAQRISTALTFEPVGAGSGEALPYLDRSVDVVAVRGDGTAATVAEARRVARDAIVVSRTGSADEAPFSTEWLRDPDVVPTLVSIVMPTYNGRALLDRCLRSLLETIPHAAPVEIVISDDGSSDGTAALAESWSGRFNLKYVRADRNQGFVDTCNRGADAASGDTLVFLNNDTLGLPGWLSPLVRTLRDHGDVGVVGGKLVHGDGRLQEAGGVIFSNGSGANFGRGAADPDAPLYGFVRDVHYVSGALLATRTELFRSLGGFDALFRPGYYEDTDYCFRVRRAGARVLYQPESAIVHLEGRTAGSGGDTGMKRHQAVNRERFRERWADVLRNHPTPPERWNESTWHQLARTSRAAAGT
jgi:GT2 family glycosyltransferase